MTHHVVHHTTHRKVAHKAVKPKKPKKAPHIHNATHSHRVSKVHTHMSSPKALSNPYKVIIV